MAARPQIEYEVPIRTGVIHQQDEFSCTDIALADMLTIIMMMNGEDLVSRASPQLTIDHQCTIPGAIKMLTYPEYGLEEVTVNPFSRLPRNIEIVGGEWIEEEYYQTPREERFRLLKIQWIDIRKHIIPALLNMFKVGGYRYPLVGLMFMGPFKNSSTAHRFASGRAPFRHRTKIDPKATRHALLIVGVNTMSVNEDEHYFLVKSSYGEEWGDRGYSRVAFGVFESILYPVHPRYWESPTWC